jgi:Rieske [2Fe-2S] domain
MSEEKVKLSGPDLTQGIELSTIPDGTMLLGHAQGEPVLLARRGDEVFAIGAICTHYGAPLEQGFSMAIRFDANGIMPVSACATARLSGRRR